MTREELFQLHICAPDESVRLAARRRWDALAKPIDGLGCFEETVARIAGMTGSTEFDLSRKALVIMCADNGIVDEGVSQTGREVTYEVASLMGKRMSSVGIMLRDYPADILTIDIGIASDDIPDGVIDRKVRRGTRNFLHTTTSSALMSILLGLDASECTGRGAGLSDEGLERKIRVINEGIAVNFPDRENRNFAEPGEVFDVLCRVGGLDIAGLAGIFMGGALYRIPIVIDGFISMISALIAERLLPGCREYMIASHLGRESGMKLLSRCLGLTPVINADLALGEGTGAVMLFPLLDMAVDIYYKMDTFEGIAVEQYRDYDAE